ncbi:MAG TPA: hypothetical protein VHU44_05195 [Acidobacteriaceae bacterium]|nr:hypothetical protein [Acidobacteriaceae bacterium]
MARRTAAKQAVQDTTTIWTVWWVLLVVFSLYVLEQSAEGILYFNNIQPNAGLTGGEFFAAPEFAPGYVAVSHVVDGGPLANAGIVRGDHLRFDRTYDWLRKKKANEAVGLTVDHNGAKSHVAVVTVPRTELTNPTQRRTLLVGVASVMPALFAVFIVWRSRGRPAALLLGSALLGFGWLDSWPQMWESGLGLYGVFVVINLIGLWVTSIFVPAFGMSFVEETIGRLPRWHWRLLAAYAAIGAVAVVLYGYCTLNAARLPIVGSADRTGTVLLMAGFAASLGYMFLGWRRSMRETQKRYSLVLMGFGTLIVAQLIVASNFLFAVGAYDPLVHWQFWVAQALSDVVAPAMLAYAIFRQRVFDLGFAINRALVYGIISTGLLVTFGLIEWASEHFVPLKSVESNALLNAGVALTIFLTFHRVRDFVEQFVEKLLFREWHDNEAKLRRFVREAGFAAKSETLAAGFVRELERFSGGAACALYVQQGSDYACAAGCVHGVAEAIDGDDPIALRMRSEHAPVELSDTASEVAAELALPMVQRAELNGFVLMGAKSNGESYRPDEREVLGWAAQNIGLDLHALKLVQLEEEAAAQRQELAILQARYQEQRVALS